MKKLALTLTVSFACMGFALAGPPPPVDAPIVMTPQSDWHGEAILYGWGASLKGDVAIAGIPTVVDVPFKDILSELDMTFMGAFGVRHGRFGVFADLIYLKVSPSFETPGPLFGRTDLELKEWIFTPKVSYRVMESDSGFIDIHAGARYTELDLRLDLRPGLLPARGGAGSEGWWDAVGGIRGQQNLSERVFLTFAADAGGGSSDYTWQALAGLGYRFTPNVHAALGYRYLDTRYAEGDFAYDVATHGPYLSLGFAW